MAYINLLPWREKKRKEKQQEFAVLSAGVAVLAAAIWGLVHIQVNGLIDAQEQRNRFLEKEIAMVEDQIKEIKALESTKENLLARMNVIQELQSNRPLSVHLMDELVRTLPDGVHLTAFVQKGNSLQMQGEAQSNARVSAYMRNIEDSEWLDNPVLDVIETVRVDRSRIAKFTLHATLKQPRVTEDEGSNP